jgi:peroxiredoxin (alkyl hydroperoxide reductase subunit C)
LSANFIIVSISFVVSSFSKPKYFARFVSESFGVNIVDEGVTLRASFIIDPEGVIKAMEVNDNSIGRSAKELLRKIKAAKFVRENGGNVCPASWEPGDDTLKPGMDLVGKI